MTGFLAARVVFTGASVVSSIGSTPKAFLASLRTQHRGLRPDHRFRAFASGALGTLAAEDLAPATRVTGDSLRENGLRRLARCVEELDNETQVFGRHAPERIGLFLGTSNSGVDSIFDEGRSGSTGGACASSLAGLSRAEFSATLNRSHLAQAPEEALRALFPITGPSFTFCTACSSAAHAIAQAARAIASGAVDAVIAGGVDLLNPMALCGFDSLQIVSQDPCRPFAVDRGGINLGEGGALFVLERAPAVRTGASAHAWFPPLLGALAGWGVASDAHHITHPEPSGEGMRRAMERALVHAEVSPEAIGYVNAHGTATLANDAAEAKAIAALFGEAVGVSSTKGLHGHALGAAGALEAAVCLAALQTGTAWAGAPIDGARYEPGVRILAQPEERALRYVLSNSFGFGGNNVSLVFAGAGEIPSRAGMNPRQNRSEVRRVV